VNATQTLHIFQRLQGRASATVNHQTKAMKKNELLSIARPLGCRIDCLQGGLWITQDGDSRDTLLSAGEHHIADGRTRLIVQALEAGVVRIAAQAN